MIKIENVSTAGWEPAIRGMRNPMNSWSKSDSCFEVFEIEDAETGRIFDAPTTKIGPNDLKLAISLCKAGSDHRKFLRDIVVYCDITAPLYWWKEYDTYKVGTVANSCSTMHKLAEKEFTLDDFSTDKLYQDVIDTSFQMILDYLNYFRRLYLQDKDKDDWYQLIQLLPSSYNQKRTVMLNYEVLRGLYPNRKNHKLDEWHDFCHWAESLPYAEELIIQ